MALENERTYPALTHRSTRVPNRFNGTTVTRSVGSALVPTKSVPTIFKPSPATGYSIVTILKVEEDQFF